MTIDLKWFLPFAGPFVVLGFGRFFWLVAGANWGDPTAAAALCLVMGILGGGALTTALAIEDICWRVRVGGRSDG
jgi:hypothetical protein